MPDNVPSRKVMRTEAILTLTVYKLNEGGRGERRICAHQRDYDTALRVLEEELPRTRTDFSALTIHTSFQYLLQ